MSNIIITGAGTGMGLSMTKKFLANDWHVIMAARNAAKAEKVYQELQDQYGDQVAMYQVDVSNGQAVAKFAEQVNAQYDQVDTVINNAGIFTDGLLHELSEEDWDKTMAVDVNRSSG